MAGECAGEPRAEQQLGGDNGLGDGVLGDGGLGEDSVEECVAVYIAMCNSLLCLHTRLHT